MIGESWGEIDVMLPKAPRQYRAVALTYLHVLFIDGSTLNELSLKYPESRKSLKTWYAHSAEMRAIGVAFGVGRVWCCWVMLSHRKQLYTRQLNLVSSRLSLTYTLTLTLSLTPLSPSSSLSPTLSFTCALSAQFDHAFQVYVQRSEGVLAAQPAGRAEKGKSRSMLTVPPRQPSLFRNDLNHSSHTLKI
eukprot:5599160-Pleurochrysis_carterae.AAC.1